MTRRSVVTGASGFVGGYLIEHLLAMGEAVVGCDVKVAKGGSGGALLGKPAVAPGGGRPDEPGLADGGVDWVRWDLADEAGLDRRACEGIERFGPEVVYHLAAVSIPADCGADEPMPEALEVNVGGTRRVLDLAASVSSRPRVLLVSTSHVYAPVTAEWPVVTEASAVGPTNGYGKTKLAAEEIGLERGRREGLDVVVARAFQHTGPRQNRRMMLAEWASQFAARSEEPVRVHTLDAHVDVTDVRDVVRAYRLLAEQGAAGCVYNVGSGVSRRSGDLFELLREMAGPGRPVVELRPGRKQEPIADVSRLVECTGWRPRIPIEETIADMWSYWRAELRG